MASCRSLRIAAHESLLGGHANNAIFPFVPDPELSLGLLWRAAWRHWKGFSLAACVHPRPQYVSLLDALVHIVTVIILALHKFCQRFLLICCQRLLIVNLSLQDLSKFGCIYTVLSAVGAKKLSVEFKACIVNAAKEDVPFCLGLLTLVKLLLLSQWIVLTKKAFKVGIQSSLFRPSIDLVQYVLEKWKPEFALKTLKKSSRDSLSNVHGTIENIPCWILKVFLRKEQSSCLVHWTNDGVVESFLVCCWCRLTKLLPRPSGSSSKLHQCHLTLSFLLNGPCNFMA